MENDADGCLSDACAALLVHQFLQVLCAHSRQVLDAHDEAQRVQNVGLAATIEPGDSIESRVKVTERYSLRIALEAVDDDLLDVHSCTGVPLQRPQPPRWRAAAPLRGRGTASKEGFNQTAHPLPRMRRCTPAGGGGWGVCSSCFLSGAACGTPLASSYCNIRKTRDCIRGMGHAPVGWPECTAEFISDIPAWSPAKRFTTDLDLSYIYHLTINNTISPNISMAARTAQQIAFHLSTYPNMAVIPQRMLFILPARNCSISSLNGASSLSSTRSKCCMVKTACTFKSSMAVLRPYALSWHL
jgi:hypothetical protein